MGEIPFPIALISENDDEINAHIRERIIDVLRKIKDAADQHKVNFQGKRLSCYRLNNVRIAINYIVSGIKRKYFKALSIEDNGFDGHVWDNDNNCITPFFSDLITRSGFDHFLHDHQFLSAFKSIYEGERGSKAKVTHLSLRLESIEIILNVNDLFKSLIDQCTGRYFSAVNYEKVLNSYVVISQCLKQETAPPIKALSAVSSQPYNFQARLQSLLLMAMIRNYINDNKEITKKERIKLFKAKLDQNSEEINFYLTEIKKLNSKNYDIDVSMAYVVLTHIVSSGNYESLPILNKLLGPHSTDGFYRDLKFQWDRARSLIPNNVAQGELGTSLSLTFTVAAGANLCGMTMFRRAFKWAANAGLITIEGKDNSATLFYVTLNAPQGIFARWDKV